MSERAARAAAILALISLTAGARKRLVAVRRPTPSTLAVTMNEPFLAMRYEYGRMSASPRRWTRVGVVHGMSASGTLAQVHHVRRPGVDGAAQSGGSSQAAYAGGLTRMRW